jgi:hypothetical protein
MTKKKAYAEQEAEHLLPLLVSIGREIKNRMRAIDALEARLEHKRVTSKASPEKLAQQAELAVHKRELRKTLRELEELGCGLDADHPLRILIPGLEGPLAFEGSLEKTSFRLRPTAGTSPG